MSEHQHQPKTKQTANYDQEVVKLPGIQCQYCYLWIWKLTG